MVDLWRSVAVGAACLLAAGCGGPNLGQVSGTVTAGGRPVTTGTIMFHPAEGPTAVGAINADGTYTLTTIKAGDGAAIGSHRVTIEATSVGSGSLADPASFEEELKLAGKPSKILVPGKVEYLVSQKYSQLETTDLTAEVKPGSNQKDFHLPKP